MLDFLTSIFLSPEAQPDPYVWCAVLLAHAAIGAATFSIFGALLRDAVTGVIFACVVWGAWELGQLAFQQGDPLDGLIDWGAVCCGAALAFGLWRHRPWLVAVAISIPAVLAWARVRRARR